MIPTAALPELIGYTKHVAWAQREQARILPEIDAASEAVIAKQGFKTPEQLHMMQEAVNNVARHAGAVWWMDRRFSTPESIVEEELEQIGKDIQLRAKVLAKKDGALSVERLLPEDEENAILDRYADEAKREWLEATGFTAGS